MTRPASSLVPLSLGALGVVFGDIGTSPLYALRECFSGEVGPTPENVLGVLSLITWSLVLVVSIKYSLLVLRADNRGEGGILALTTLAVSRRERATERPSPFVAVGLIGAALMFGDGMLTPAISVASAVEGLGIAAPALASWAPAIAVAVLLGLFAIQRNGTAAVGAWFGPLMLVWFGSLALLGLTSIAREPHVLGALSPLPGIDFFARNGWTGTAVVGAVFLVVTGGEALYADMGHFGRAPIRIAWFGLALPALLANYFGQGALLLTEPSAVANPFYLLAPTWALYPLTALATAAGVVASQAVISGCFSLTHQAIQLGYLPRLHVRHTSAQQRGQIYVGATNRALAVASCGLVVGFGSSSELAGAYGLAVSGIMVATSALLCTVARRRWGWSIAAVAAIAVPMLALDLAFLSASTLKLASGGWISLAVAVLAFAGMTTWRRGRSVLESRLDSIALPIELFLDDPALDSLPRVPGRAIFLTSNARRAPIALLHNLKHNKVAHAQTVALEVDVADVPSVAAADRVSVRDCGRGFYVVNVRVGFMEVTDVPAAVASVPAHELPGDPRLDSYFIGREKLIPSGRSGMARWRERVFAWMAWNAQNAADYFHLPTSRVVELGSQVEL